MVEEASQLFRQGLEMVTPESHHHQALWTFGGCTLAFKKLVVM